MICEWRLMFFGEKHISKKLSIFSLNRLTFAFDPIYGQLCHLYLFNGTLGQHERTRAKENELLIRDVIRVEIYLEGHLKLSQKSKENSCLHKLNPSFQKNPAMVNWAGGGYRGDGIIPHLSECFFKQTRKSQPLTLRWQDSVAVLFLIYSFSMYFIMRMPSAMPQEYR